MGRSKQHIRWVSAVLFILVGIWALVLSAGGQSGESDAVEHAVADDVTPINSRPKKPKALPRPQTAGAIETVTQIGTSVTISGWAIDLDSPDSQTVRVSLDGEFVTLAPADGSREDVSVALRLGALHGFEVTVEIPAEDSHNLCVFTHPDDDLVACRRVAAEDHKGVLITPRGVMVEILKVREDSFRVLTPCGNKAIVKKGERVRTTQILLDPGHGGSEVASVGPNRLSEKDLNLDVAKRAAAALRELGYSVELTRTTDVRLPIAIRAGLANALQPDLFLSIHHNGGATRRKSVPGTQVYYQHDDPEAQRAGGILYEELFAAALEFPTQWVGNVLDGVSTRLNDRGTDFYGIHRRTPDVTSVITEFLWVSNAAEANLLAGSAIRDAEATALARGVDRWFRTTNSGSGYLPDFVDTFDSGGGGFENCVDPRLS